MCRGHFHGPGELLSQGAIFIKPLGSPDAHRAIHAGGRGRGRRGRALAAGFGRRPHLLRNGRKFRLRLLARGSIRRQLLPEGLQPLSHCRRVLPVTQRRALPCPGGTPRRDVLGHAIKHHAGVGSISAPPRRTCLHRPGKAVAAGSRATAHLHHCLNYTLLEPRNSLCSLPLRHLEILWDLLQAGGAAAVCKALAALGVTPAILLASGPGLLQAFLARGLGGSVVLGKVRGQGIAHAGGVGVTAARALGWAVGCGGTGLGRAPSA
mmetsp:Transcript_65241/g.206088  ORF Transcript_65241/g.206088 Transcript_65241/m.206088 type:complete len:265 (+) Transcript_65241:674-1468(+)